MSQDAVHVQDAAGVAGEGVTSGEARRAVDEQAGSRSQPIEERLGELGAAIEPAALQLLHDQIMTGGRRVDSDGSVPVVFRANARDVPEWPSLTADHGSDHPVRARRPSTDPPPACERCKQCSSHLRVQHTRRTNTADARMCAGSSMPDRQRTRRARARKRSACAHMHPHRTRRMRIWPCCPERAVGRTRLDAPHLRLAGLRQQRWPEQPRHPARHRLRRLFRCSCSRIGVGIAAWIRRDRAR
jgi:hypothetical protein